MASGIGEIARVSVRGNLKQLVTTFRAQSESVRDTLQTNSRTTNKYSTSSLSYPLNVEGDPQQGHYISFYARVQNKAKLKAFKAQNRIDKVEKLLGAGAGQDQKQLEGLFGGNYISDQQLVGFNKDTDTVRAVRGTSQNSGVKSNSIQLKRNTTVRDATAISLYMPPSVQVSYESKYGDQEIGFLAETGYEALKAFQSGANTADATRNILSGLELGVKKAILKTLDVAAPGASTLFAIDRGKIIAPKMELMFEGIGRRSFSFAFVFIPKSEQEAEVVKQIIYKFKHHMAANFTGGGSSGQREMGFPDMFDIEYMHVGKQNPNLNKIATCALTKMDVEYGGDRYVAYEGGVPQTTKLSLSFTEFDIITKEHVEAGF